VLREARLCRSVPEQNKQCSAAKTSNSQEPPGKHADQFPGRVNHLASMTSAVVRSPPGDIQGGAVSVQHQLQQMKVQDDACDHGRCVGSTVATTLLYYVTWHDAAALKGPLSLSASDPLCFELTHH
jgi:hypothetical protein